MLMIVNGGIKETVTVILGRIVVMLWWVRVTVFVKLAVIVVTRLSSLGDACFETRGPFSKLQPFGRTNAKVVLTRIISSLLSRMKCLVA